METFTAIQMRRSVRAYDSRKIPPAIMQRLLDSLRIAPSGWNNQPWKFILVQDSSVKAELAQACKKQMWIAEAPLIVVGCGYPEKAYKTMGGYGNSVEIDLAIALDHLSIAAVGEGLGTCWIGGFDEKTVKKLLGVPSEVKVVALMPVGFPQKNEQIYPKNEKKRKKPEEIFIQNRWDYPCCLDASHK